ncbi:restriction endonuclease subunit S [Staphylococcus pettenkoferi]|uniref:restriction endonuclease subunit S n=1 Tax=Staphylococcus pettenkoferi TaxID=170573 RepID=UPI002276E36C|nr:restriction endonuclease subunit S [Staphylococcus pettenkoferi]MCY1593443.1 restriction endonuclease subunit S [Staphylococcus pettenkoferi]MCY1612045.1 restriction endonuclease subunit S [Staphylococcus pettenkoferi]MCY1625861.1 restriction endonuclease subunit S [Staphylococcus pettenkoferi]
MTNEIKNVPELRFPEFKEGWSKLKLGELAEIVRGSSPRPISDPRWFDINSDIGWLRISDVTEQNGKITKLEQKISKDGQKKTRVLHSKHLLLSIAASVGKPVINYVKTGVHDGFLIFLKPLFDIEFMYQWLDAYRPKWKKYGQPGSQVNLNSELVKSQKIYMPHSVEQKKISDFFSKLDRQIELEEQKLEKLEEQKKGYMQKIFSQELRFKDKNGNEYPEWEVIKLKDILSERKEYASKIGNYPHATLSTSGISLKSDRYNRDFLVKDKNKKYKVTIMNDICYNPANLKFGVITRNHIGSVIFSPIYITFEVNNAHSPLFIELLVTRNDFINRVRKYEEGTVYERMAVKPEDFLNYETKIPCLEEQEKIGNFFSKLDELINKQNQKIDGLKKRKRGFLQKMFV